MVPFFLFMDKSEGFEPEKRREYLKRKSAGMQI